MTDPEAPPPADAVADQWEASLRDVAMTDPKTPPPAGAAPPTTCIEAEPFALRVIDDSMEPEFAPGCIIVVDPTGVARDGAFVLAEVDGEYIFRMLRRTDEGDDLVALNRDYPPVTLAAGFASVRGVVVQRAGARRRYHKRYG